MSKLQELVLVARGHVQVYQQEIRNNLHLRHEALELLSTDPGDFELIETIRGCDDRMVEYMQELHFWEAKLAETLEFKAWDDRMAAKLKDFDRRMADLKARLAKYTA